MGDVEIKGLEVGLKFNPKPNIYAYTLTPYLSNTHTLTLRARTRAHKELSQICLLKEAPKKGGD
jgi:hypothetical protein